MEFPSGALQPPDVTLTFGNTYEELPAFYDTTTPRHHWTFYITGDTSSIQVVELSSTFFSDVVVLKRDFFLSGRSYGPFDIKVKVTFKNKSVAYYTHPLSFRAPNSFRQVDRSEFVNTTEVTQIPAILQEESPLVRVAVYNARGMSVSSVKGCYAALNNDKRFQVHLVTAQNLLLLSEYGSISDHFDVFVCPGGGHYQALQDLGSSGRMALKEFIIQGGGFIGVCGGTYFATDLGIANISVKGTNINNPYDIWAQGKSTFEPLEGFEEVCMNYGGDKRENISAVLSRGLFFRLGPLMHAVPSGTTHGGSYYTQDDSKHFGNIIPLAVFTCDLVEEQIQNISSWESQLLGMGITELPEVGKIKPGQMWNPGKVGVMPGSWAIVTTTYGEGKVVLFSPHPELTDSNCDGGDKHWMLSAATFWSSATSGIPALGKNAANWIIRSSSLDSIDADESLDNHLSNSNSTEEFESLFKREQPEPCTHLNQFKFNLHKGMLALPCSAPSCPSEGSNQDNWICLVCFKVFCGRYSSGHMAEHARGHVDQACVALSTRTLECWCYGCDDWFIGGFDDEKNRILVQKLIGALRM
jgi:hypothetical protein